MKHCLILSAYLLFWQFAQAQKTDTKVRFRSINQVGAVTGAQKDAPIIQTINGLAYKSWSAGMGVGIDMYSERSVPVFIDIRKSFGQGNNIPFIYADGGLSFAWLSFIEKEQQSFPEHEKDSWYYDAGIGWKIPLGVRTAFLLSAGYSLKQYEGSRIAYRPFTGGPAIEYREPFENTYRRIIIKIGVQL